MEAGRAAQPVELIARVNRARRDNPALQSDASLRFYPVDNDSLLCYAKSDAELENLVVAVVNLDPHHVQSGWSSSTWRRLASTRIRPTRCTTCSPARAFSGAGRATSSSSIRSARRRMCSRCGASCAPNAISTTSCVIPGKLHGQTGRSQRQGSAGAARTETGRPGRGALVQGRGRLPAAHQGLL